MTIQNELNRILMDELRMEPVVRLHREGRYWCAYEYSAYLFSNFIHPAHAVLRSIPRTPRRVACVYTTDALLKKCASHYSSIEYKPLQLVLVPLSREAPPTDFTHWREGVTDRFEDMKEEDI